MTRFDARTSISHCAHAPTGTVHGRAGCMRWKREPGIDDEPAAFHYPPELPEIPKTEPWRPVSRDGWWTEPPRPRRPVREVSVPAIVVSADQALRLHRMAFVRIGINDADNRVFLPSKKVGMRGYPKAAHHKPYHDPEYHYEVYIRLQRGSNEAGGRIELKGMKKDVLAGRMSL